MSEEFLDFEQPIAELQAKIEELRLVPADGEVDIGKEVARLQNECDSLTGSIFSKLTPWQITQLARHPRRPHMLDYVDLLFTEFQQLHGDRRFADDAAIIGGLASFEGQPVMIIGHQKGRGIKEQARRNFGMGRPEGYRKALRLMRLAEKFQIPVVTFIDTPGAHPGIGSEERGQSHAIAANLKAMATLKTPIVCLVIGEGESAGALALGVGDRVFMLAYSIYSVVSPERCATKLWESPDQVEAAANALGLTAEVIVQQQLIDGVIQEPLGGAHRDPKAMADNIRHSLSKTLESLCAVPLDELISNRLDKLAAVGRQ